MTECRFCNPLPCEQDWHDAAINIHAELRALVNCNWVEDMAKAKAKAKKLWKVRRPPKPDYRVIPEGSEGLNPRSIIARLLATEREKQARPIKAAPESIQRGARLGGMASKQTKRPSRAEYMRQYRKAHAEPRSMTPAEAGRKGGRASGVARRMGKHGL